MQCVIYISNKSQYLKNEERYGKTIDGVPLSFQEFFQIRQLKFHFIYTLNWTNFPPKSTHQQQLLRDCCQNNVTAEKEALNDVIWETNMASKLNTFSNFNRRYLLN